MITKGIVEEILTNYSIKVRLPILDSIEGTRDATPTSDLSEAIVCVAPNSEINFTVGDIVIVGFEDNDDSKPIILGFLFKESGNTSSISNNLSKLNVNVSAKLPRDTSIGNVSSQDISMLQGAKFNIQSQLNNITETYLPLSGGTLTGALTADKINIGDFNIMDTTHSLTVMNTTENDTQLTLSPNMTLVGSIESQLYFRGNKLRPTYLNQNNQLASIALLSDVDALKNETNTTLSAKANLDASNLSSINKESWKTALNCPKSVWEQVGRFSLSSNTEFWYNAYNFDFTNYDYKLEGRLITVSGNSRSIFAFANSSGNWITYPIRWVQIRGSSTTTSGSSLNTDGYAVAENQNYIWLCDSINGVDRAYITEIELNADITNTRIYFKTLSTGAYSGQFRYFTGAGFVYNVDFSQIAGISFDNWYGAGTYINIYRRKKAV